MNVITRARVKSLTKDFLIKYTMYHINDITKNKIIGSRNRRKALKIVFDSKGPLISELSMNQSKERKASEDPPKVSNGIITDVIIDG